MSWILFFDLQALSCCWRWKVAYGNVCSLSLLLFREITPPAGFAVLSTEQLLHAVLHCTICTMSTLYTAQSVQCVHIVHCNMVHCCKTLCQEITPSANLYLPLIYPVLLCTVQLTAEIMRHLSPLQSISRLNHTQHCASLSLSQSKVQRRGHAQRTNKDAGSRDIPIHVFTLKSYRILLLMPYKLTHYFYLEVEFIMHVCFFLFFSLWSFIASCCCRTNWLIISFWKRNSCMCPFSW